MVWRALFILSAIAFFVGGPMHPGGETMAEMLADPSWVPGHAIVLAGFLALLGGLVLHRRSLPLSARSNRWSRNAIIGTALMALEMAVHTAAAVDAENAAAGLATPVATTHLWMARTLYPLFGVLLAGFVAAAARDRTLASRWIAPLGVFGALAWGAGPPAVTWLGESWAILFPVGLMTLALWILLAGLWPNRSANPSPATD